MNKNTNEYWQNLMDSYLEHLRETKCQKDKLSRSRSGMKSLIEYALKNGHSEYTPEIGYAFYESEKKKAYAASTIGYRRTTIRDLNKYLFGQVFWQRTPRAISKYNTSHIPPNCPEQFSEVLEQFLLRLCA